MVIVMQTNATDEQLEQLTQKVQQAGFGVHLSRGAESITIGVIGGERLALDALELNGFPGVRSVVWATKPYSMVSRECHPEDTIVMVGDVPFGGGSVPFIGGPCAVEGRDLYLEAARVARVCGATVLRGGAYRQRSSPSSFQGLGEEGLRILAEAREEVGLPVCTEVMDVNTVQLVAAYVDLVQVGARNAQNYALLQALGHCGKPVLLNRGLDCTIEEWLSAAECILSHGNPNVILCESGVRSFETASQLTLDICAVPVAKSMTHLPVVVDPSHAAGKRQWVSDLARSGVAARCDGLHVQCHPHPDESVSDAAQALHPMEFAQMVRDCGAIADAIGRYVPLPLRNRAQHDHSGRPGIMDWRSGR